jgi:hypothetical protein
MMRPQAAPNPGLLRRPIDGDLLSRNAEHMAPKLPATSDPDDVLVAVLEAVRCAPLVPLTDEEKDLLAEVEGRPVAWISNEEFMSRVGLPPSDDHE